VNPSIKNANRRRDAPRLRPRDVVSGQDPLPTDDAVRPEPGLEQSVSVIEGSFQALCKGWPRGPASRLDSPAKAVRSGQEPAVPWRPQSNPELSSLNVEQRLAYLRTQFSPGEADESKVDAGGQSRNVKDLFRNVLVRRAAKSAAALVAVGLVVWMPAQRLFQTTSVEAIVNARTLTLRAPIDGTVSSVPTELAVGATFPSGTALLRISNSRADRTRFDDLRRLEERTKIETAGLKTRLDSIEQMHGEFVAQTQLFQIGRIAQLEARIEESKSNLAAAATRQEETAAVLKRALELDTKGFQPKALLEKVRRDDQIAKQDVRSIENRIKGIMVELESARSGSFLGDSYNDRPRSSQRADELQQQIIELSSQLTEKQSTLLELQQEINVERDRLQLNSDASVLAPSSSKVWELLTASGEHVQRGQELMRLLDCNAALVTAVVSEAVYNRLQIGSAASFRLRDGYVAMPGRVVNLTGVASAAANYAIAPSSLLKEQYRVAVEVPDLRNDGQGCNLGRTGQVVFTNQSPSPITPAAH
jgi:multidrug resistance efflux pump